MSLAALGLLTVAGGAASAQQALTIRPTSSPDIDVTGSGLGDGGVLRGTDGTGATLPTVPADGLDAAAPLDAEAPDQPVPLRRTIAGQGSALMPSPAGAPRLPALEAYPTNAPPLRGVSLDALEAPAAARPAPTVAALPAPPRRRLPLDPEPFAPIGYTLGALRLTPYVEESLGYDSNPDQSSSGVKGSGFSRTEGGFTLLSLWSSNELRSTMHAGYDEYFSNPGANRPDANGTVDYRYDASRDLVLDGEVRFAVSTQRPGSPELSASVQGRPLVSSYGATLGATQTLGRLELGLHGLFDRTSYENGTLSDGTEISLDRQNFNDYGVTLRADYKLTPTLKPFAEVTVDDRVHDSTLDESGYARDSVGVLGRLGTSFQLTPLVTGTVSAGYENRSYDDARLKDLRGPLVDATIAYAITPLTTLTLLASTSFDETNLAGSSGAESHNVSLQVSHALLRNLTLSATLGYLNTDYIGSPIVENSYSATLKASYAISRSLVLEGTYQHQTLVSSDKASGFGQDLFMVGLRLQH